MWVPCGVEGVRGSLTGPPMCALLDLLLLAHTETALMTVRAPSQCAPGVQFDHKRNSRH